MSSESGPGNEPEPYDTSPWPLYVRPTPRRWPWLVAGPAVVLLVLGVIGVRALQDDDGATDPTAIDSSSASIEPTPDPSLSPGPEPSPAPTLTAIPSATPEPSASSETARFTCWDDVRVARLADCSQPDGQAGLRYVFPSLRGQSCQSSGGPTDIGLVLRFRCSDELNDGTQVTIDYSQWASVEDGVAHYDGLRLTRADAADIYGWSGSSEGLPTAAFVYRSDPFSVSWSASTTEALSSALSTAVVEGRPPGEVRGDPIS